MSSLEFLWSFEGSKNRAWKHTLNPMINSQISYVKKEIVKMSGTRFENKLNSAYDWIQINIKFGILTFKLRSALSLLEKHIQYQLYIKRSLTMRWDLWLPIWKPMKTHFENNETRMNCLLLHRHKLEWTPHSIS